MAAPVSVAATIPVGEARSPLAAAAQIPAALQAKPAIVVHSDRSYAGAQFGVAGVGLSPDQRLTLDVMPTRDPGAGAPISSTTLRTAARSVSIERPSREAAAG